MESKDLTKGTHKWIINHNHQVINDGKSVVEKLLKTQLNNFKLLERLSHVNIDAQGLCTLH